MIELQWLDETHTMNFYAGCGVKMYQLLLLIKTLALAQTQSFEWLNNKKNMADNLIRKKREKICFYKQKNSILLVMMQLKQVQSSVLSHVTWCGRTQQLLLCRDTSFRSTQSKNPCLTHATTEIRPNVKVL